MMQVWFCSQQHKEHVGAVNDRFGLSGFMSPDVTTRGVASTRVRSCSSSARYCAAPSDTIGLRPVVSAELDRRPTPPDERPLSERPLHAIEPRCRFDDFGGDTGIRGAVPRVGLAQVQRTAGVLFDLSQSVRF